MSTQPHSDDSRTDELPDQQSVPVVVDLTADTWARVVKDTRRAIERGVDPALAFDDAVDENIRLEYEVRVRGDPVEDVLDELDREG